MVKTIRRWSLVPVVVLRPVLKRIRTGLPDQAIRMVAPYPAGGVVDFVARQIGQKWLA